MADNDYILPVMDTVKEAWAKVNGFKGVVWGFLILAYIALIILVAVNNQIHGALHALGGILTQLLGCAMMWVLLYMGILRALGRPVNLAVTSYLLQPKMFAYLVGAYLIKTVIPGIIIGLSVVLIMFVGQSHFMATLIIFLAVIVVFYVLMRMYLIVDFVLMNDMNPIAALQASLKATQFNVVSLMGLTLLNLLLYIASIIPLGIGLIWFVPYIQVCFGEVYKKLVVDRAPIPSPVKDN
ncbi:MAG: hypothetical protein P4M12_07225 [Gammaproteobacteria bacterium]|nr:hypothetical protein [Gammaproteobacteria bacterium]